MGYSFLFNTAARAIPWFGRTFFWSRTALAVNGTLATDHFVFDGKGMEAAGSAAKWGAGKVAPIYAGETGNFLQGLGVPDLQQTLDDAKQRFGFSQDIAPEVALATAPPANQEPAPVAATAPAERPLATAPSENATVSPVQPPVPAVAPAPVRSNKPYDEGELLAGLSTLFNKVSDNPALGMVLIFSAALYEAITKTLEYALEKLGSLLGEDETEESERINDPGANSQLAPQSAPQP